jgi:vanillate monooxygenase ferredoxin subunit
MKRAESIEVVIRDAWDEAEGIRAFRLEPVSGTRLPDFAAGAHIDVEIPDVGIRQYSLCNAAGQTSHWVIAVQREDAGRGGSKALHGYADVGRTLLVSHPRNAFALQDGQHHAVLLAGGVGITPIISMARTLAAAGASFELHYASRSVARTAFRAALESAPLQPRTRLYFDDQGASAAIDLRQILSRQPAGSHCYVCGPTGFMDAVLGTANELGWQSAHVHKESFQPSDGAPGDAFRIRIASTGDEFLVPEDKRVLDVLLDHGYEIETSCEQGVCGSCVTGVLDGEPDHQDMFLSDSEREANNCFTPCCSRAKGDLLVLDL